MMTSLACKVFHTSIFGPEQRHTHFKGVGFGSNAVGAGRWWMYTTLSMAQLPSSMVLFMSLLAGATFTTTLES